MDADIKGKLQYKETALQYSLLEEKDLHEIELDIICTVHIKYLLL